MEKRSKTGYTIKRIGGYLHKLVPIADSTGKVISYVTAPLMVELRPRDVMQIVVGASILAIPVGFTEETWTLGERLPLNNVLLLTLVSVLFIAAFVYFNFYRFELRDHVLEYVKRVVAIYTLSLIVVGILLTIIEKCPWGVDNVLALKRIIIVAFPASMSAAVSDTVK
jgi:uncharacterized membrane protein